METCRQRIDDAGMCRSHSPSTSGKDSLAFLFPFLYNQAMQLYFIRHGQSANNALWDTTGASAGRSDDPELTDAGKQQAALLAQYLAQGGNRFGITHLYTSLMLRAVQTATPAGDALHLPVHPWEDLHEVGGIYLDNDAGEPIGRPGQTRAQFMANHPALVLPESVYEAGWWNRPHESQEAAQTRAKRFFDDLLARHGRSEDVVAVVSHGDFFRHFLCVALRVPDPKAVWFTMQNTAIARIDFPGDWNGVVIRYQNRIDHLPAEWVT